MRRFLRRTNDAVAIGGTSVSVVKTNPASPSENVIQAIADVPDLTLRPFSNTQASPVMLVENASGSVIVASVRSGQTADFTDAVLFIQPPVPKMFGLVLQSPVGGIASQFLVNDSGGNSQLFVQPTGDGACVTIQSFDVGDIPLQIVGMTGGSANLLRIDADPLHFGAFTVDASGDVLLNRTNSLNLQSVVARLQASFLDPTIGTFQGRGELYADDFNASRLCLRWEADGTEARMAFLGGGVNAAPRQLLATGAGHTVDDVITVLQTFGLCKQS